MHDCDAYIEEMYTYVSLCILYNYRNVSLCILKKCTLMYHCVHNRNVWFKDHLWITAVYVTSFVIFDRKFYSKVTHTKDFSTFCRYLMYRNAFFKGELWNGKSHNSQIFAHEQLQTCSCLFISAQFHSSKDIKKIWIMAYLWWNFLDLSLA